MTDKAIIYVVDDEDAVRRSVGFMLRTSGYEVHAFASGVEFLKEVKKLDPGCVLLDVRMPDMDGLEVQQQLNAHGVAMPVIVLTGHGDVATAVQAMKRGASDFLEKPFEKASLIEAIERGSEKIGRKEQATKSEHEAKVRIAALTAREQDVLRELVRGHPNKTIAYDLGISPRTVEVHRANVMSKLGVRSLSDALRIAFAARLGETR
ncbi:MAG TPA: response regulator [Sphingomonas sp.]|jgi:two-component system response regulator FixJ|nr:response regulator [Sphingomonas sp.]